MMAASTVFLIGYRKESSALQAGFRYILVHFFGGAGRRALKPSGANPTRWIPTDIPSGSPLLGRFFSSLRSPWSISRREREPHRDQAMTLFVWLPPRSSFFHRPALLSWAAGLFLVCPVLLHRQGPQFFSDRASGGGCKKMGNVEQRLKKTAAKKSANGKNNTLLFPKEIC